ncbi:metallophosphoesterase [Methylorubrum populi BJ001]|jgi:predicted MPP superfamily phosphohydrolase|uniref:Metallophosphoesterase n=1 Tax=Methylorubrum populi (strain ATCC BAA-705 / NCIMB 13946 / BJ001) TaxID=441620 RepID=B1ZAS9_METPB|nr:metallophosphoesterase [Methylorubrum populi]ACB83402.1 metallophosphoesterase [Methylorubrum populi BJ001]OAH38353.1 metallophosphoesterase [Methylorubrum populi]PZP67389.1 MAG: metallophosphoesterase [Methylorubrum populi]
MPENGRRSPVSITRRTVLIGLGATALTGAGTGAYAVGVEPMRLSVTRYRLRPTAPWPSGLRLRIVALADIHACEPWMSLARIKGIVAAANALRGDVIVLLGDYVSGMRLVTRYVDAAEWAPVLGRLNAPLGTYAILGNHDWWEDKSAQARGRGPTIAGEALRRAGISVLENDAVPLSVRGHEVWVAGLGDQLAFVPSRKRHAHPRLGVDDLAATLARIPDGAPAILLAHEPDIFPQVPPRIALTLSGHTHGGQVRLFGRSPIVPSLYGNRFAYGYVREQTDLIVSGGLGNSIAPIRLGVPPEIVVVDLGADGDAAS